MKPLLPRGIIVHPLHCSPDGHCRTAPLSKTTRLLRGGGTDDAAGETLGLLFVPV
jgi:hypothetical protein